MLIYILILIILTLLTNIIYHRIYPKLQNPSLLTMQELSKFDGKKNKKVYVALKNIIFDVSSSESYKPGNSYNALAGHDASVSLAKMSLDEEFLDMYNKVVLKKDEIKTLEEWVVYFEEKKKYPVVGFLKKYK